MAKAVDVEELSKPPQQHQSFDSAPADVDFAGVAGKYINAGYGPIEFCLVTPTNQTQSPTCKDLIAQAPTSLPGTIDPAVPTLLAKWDRVWVSHLRLVRRQGNIFDGHALASFVSTTLMQNPQGCLSLFLASASQLEILRIHIGLIGREDS